MLLPALYCYISLMMTEQIHFSSCSFWISKSKWFSKLSPKPFSPCYARILHNRKVFSRFVSGHLHSTLLFVNRTSTNGIFSMFNGFHQFRIYIVRLCICNNDVNVIYWVQKWKTFRFYLSRLESLECHWTLMKYSYTIFLKELKASKRMILKGRKECQSIMVCFNQEN